MELPAEISSEGGPPTLEDMDSGNDGCKGTSSRNEMENESFTVVVHDGIPAPTPKPVISTNLTTPQEATAGTHKYNSMQSCERQFIIINVLLNIFRLSHFGSTSLVSCKW